jgi:hypothetical protein
MEINKKNYKDWLVRYLENDLNVIERIETEQFINENSFAAREWELLKRTRLEPDLSIKFPDKKLLFRTEDDVVELKKPVRVFNLYQYAALAAAAAVLAFVIIFSIHKPENKIETAHSNIRSESSPSISAPEKARSTVPSQSEPTLAQDVRHSHVERKDQRFSKTVSKNLLAKQMPQNIGEQKTVHKQIQEPQSIKSESVASNITLNPAAVQPEKVITQGPPIQQIASVKQPVRSDQAVPVRTVSYSEDDNQSTLQSLMSLLHKVSIKKKVENQQTYYALSLETPDIKINKTIR